LTTSTESANPLSSRALSFARERGSFFLLGLFWLFCAMLPLGQRQLSNLRDLGLIIVVLGFLLEALRAEFLPWRRRDWLAALLPGAAGALLCGLIIHHRGASFSIRDAIVPPLLLVISWSLYLQSKRIERRTSAPPFGATSVQLCLPLLSSLFFLSACLSLRPDLSFAHYGREGGLYIPLAQLLISRFRERGRCSDWARPVLWTGFLYACASVLIFGLGLLGDYETRLWLEGGGYIRFDWLGDSDRPWRVQFPFGHHNRMASYFLYVLFLTVAWFATRTNRRGQPWWVLLVLLPSAAILVSKTRGAYLAVVAGSLLTLFSAFSGIWAARNSARSFLRLRRYAVWGFVVGVLGLSICLSLPGPRRQLLSTVNPRTYIEGRGSLGLRFPAWRAGLEMILDRPVFGIGYGTKVFEAHYEKNYMVRFEDVEKKPHAHNNLLEIALESGIPAMGVFFWMNLVVWVGLWRARRERRELWIPALIGMFAAVHVYGIANYNLRQGNGFIFWLFFAVMLYLGTRAPDSGPHGTPAAIQAKKA
jgi:O-antigen ligase